MELDQRHADRIVTSRTAASEFNFLCYLIDFGIMIKNPVESNEHVTGEIED
jgi:RIO-like serine/threonine protein kinase